MSAVEHVARELRVIEAEVAAECGLPFTGWADLTEVARDEYRVRARRLLHAAGLAIATPTPARRRPPRGSGGGVTMPHCGSWVSDGGKRRHLICVLPNGHVGRHKRDGYVWYSGEQPRREAMT